MEVVNTELVLPSPFPAKWGQNGSKLYGRLFGTAIVIRQVNDFKRKTRFSFPACTSGFSKQVHSTNRGSPKEG